MSKAQRIRQHARAVNKVINDKELLKKHLKVITKEGWRLKAFWKFYKNMYDK